MLVACLCACAVCWNATQILETLHLAPSYGIDIGTSASSAASSVTSSAASFLGLKGAKAASEKGAGGRLDWAKLKEVRDRYIQGLQDTYQDNAHQDHIQIFPGKAAFLNSTQIQVTDHDGKQTVLHAPHVCSQHTLQLPCAMCCGCDVVIALV